MKRKLKAAILGFGSIGHAHADGYRDQPDCELVAVADNDPGQLQCSSAELNLGTTDSLDLSKLRRYGSFEELIASEELDIIDICVPTDFHAHYAIAALQHNINVLSEKPMAPNLREADAMIAAAEKSGKALMIGQCLRFYPCYEELKRMVDEQRFGRLLRLSMRRISGLPRGLGYWFRDGRRSGGALLDMHIHDTDFANYLFGVPDSVVTFGCTHYTGAIDDAITHYIYRDGPLVSAETSWSLGAFSMSFEAIFENASVEMKRADELIIDRLDQQPEVVKLSPEGGHRREISYFASCILNGEPVDRCTPWSARETIRIALAEERSARNGGRRVAVGGGR